MQSGLQLRVIAAFVLLLITSSVSWAQATRTWVSGVGDDANPCSRTAPCKTFAGAISKTAAAGEINVLDPGGFGAVTITKSINLVATGTFAGIVVSGTNGIIVNAGANDVVSIRGLDIAGVGGQGLSGILVNQAAQVEIENCQIYGFSTAGVNLSSPSQFSRVHIVNSSIFANTVGVMVQATSATNGMVLESTIVDHNTTANISVSGTTAALLLNDSSLLASSTAIASSGGSPSLQSFGNNRIVGSAPVLTAVGLK